MRRFAILLLLAFVAILDKPNLASAYTCTSPDPTKRDNCLACQAIKDKNNIRLERLLSGPYYVDISTMDVPCGGSTKAGFLYGAAQHDNFAAARILLDNGADPNQTNDIRQVRPVIFDIDYYAKPPNKLDYWKLFLDRGMNTDIRFDQSFTNTPVWWRVLGQCGNYAGGKTILAEFASRASNPYSLANGNISIAHYLGWPSRFAPCQAEFLRQNNIEPQLTKANLVARNLYQDSAGATIIDYALSEPRWRYPSQSGYGLCGYAGETYPYNNYAFARYLGSLDPELQREYDAKKNRAGQTFACSIAPIMIDYLTRPLK